MAENNSPLSIVIDADISKLQKAISDVRESIGQISSAITNTDLGDFGKGLEQTLSQINTRLDQLEGSLQKTATTAKTFTTGTKDARTALTSLSLVAQDAPFGFIAIQNNLPAVLSSFSELTKGSAGLKGALSQIGSALVGPAGLFLAFSAVTGAVTFAIQNYGSLGAAIDAITGNTNQFTEAIQKANKSLAEYNKNAKSNIELRNDSIGAVENEIIKVNALADVLRSSTTTDRQKQGALSELKKANDEYFGKLNAQKLDLDALNESVKLYSESLIKNKVAQNLASEAAGVFTEFLKQNQIAFDIAEKINKAFKDVPTLTKQLEDYTKKRDKLIEQGEITAIRFIPISKELAQYFKLNDQLKEVNKNVKSTANSYETLSIQANAAFKAASGFLDFKDDKGGKVGKEESFKFEIEPIADTLSLQQRISQLEKLGTILLDTKSKESDRIQALKELADLEYEVWGGIKLQDLSYKELRATLTGVGKTYQQLILQEEQRRESLRLTEEAIRRQAFLNKEDEKVFLANIKSKRDELTKLALAIPKTITVPVNIPINQAQLEELKRLAIIGIEFGNEEKETEDREKRITDSVKKLNSVIENGLRKPFRDFFDELLDNGKFTFDSFVDFAKDAFRRILADLAAAGIARILTSILTGGQSDAILAGGTIFDAIFGKKIAAPSFGGVGGGPLQMAGSVNLQLRGSDLVASINRTNSTINRIG